MRKAILSRSAGMLRNIFVVLYPHMKFQLQDSEALPPQVFVSSESHALVDAPEPPRPTKKRLRTIPSASTIEEGSSHLSHSTFEVHHLPKYASQESGRFAPPRSVHRPSFPISVTSVSEGIREPGCSRPVSYTGSFLDSFDSKIWDPERPWDI